MTRSTSRGTSRPTVTGVTGDGPQAATWPPPDLEVGPGSPGHARVTWTLYGRPSAVLQVTEDLDTWTDHATLLADGWLEWPLDSPRRFWRLQY